MPDPAFDMPRTGTWEERSGWIVRRLATDIACKDFQAAGVVGQFGFESEEFKTMQERGIQPPRGGWGWAQWTGPRRVNFNKWVAQRGLNPSSDEANYGFLVFELLGDYKGFAAQLRQTTTIEEACRLAHEKYERPSDVLDGTYRSGPARLSYALRALTGARAQASTSTAQPQPQPSQPAPETEDREDLPFNIPPRELIKLAQWMIGAVPDGIPGPDTMKKLAEYEKQS